MFRLFLVLAVLIVIFISLGCSDNDSDSSSNNSSKQDHLQVYEDVHRCDEEVADPNDRDRFARGVTDDELIPKRAIKVCEQAVSEHPETPRFYFQLGRAQLAYGDIEAAQKSLEKAVDLNYAPALAYLAYLISEADPERSSEYYRLAREGGYDVDWDQQTATTQDNKISVSEAKSRVAQGEQFPLKHSNTFHPDLFHDGRTLSYIYDGDFETLNAKLNLGHLLYFSAMIDYYLEPVNYIYPNCAGVADPALRQEVMNIALGAYGLGNNPQQSTEQAGMMVLKQMAEMLKNPNPGALIGNVQSKEIAKERGKHDAVKIAKYYDCVSPTFQRFYSNLSNFIYNKEPSVASGWVAMQIGCYDYVRKKGGEHNKSKSTCKCITDKFRSAGVTRENAEWLGANYDHGRNFSKVTESYKGLKNSVVSNCLL